MIYLIDDTPLNDVGANFLADTTYKGHIVLIDTEDKLKKHSDDLTSAECILVHRSFNNSDKTKQEMCKLSDDGDKFPIVTFSAGDADTAVYDPGEMPNEILGISKLVFYARLQPFLDNYVKTGNIDLPVIAYGEKKTFKEIRPLCLSLLEGLESGNSKEVEFILKTPEFEKIIQASQPTIKITKDVVLSDFLSERISVTNIVDNIISILNSFEKYGKNIYPWK